MLFTALFVCSCAWHRRCKSRGIRRRRHGEVGVSSSRSHTRRATTERGDSAYHNTTMRGGVFSPPPTPIEVPSPASMKLVRTHSTPTSRSRGPLIPMSTQLLPSRPTSLNSLPLFVSSPSSRSRLVKTASKGSLVVRPSSVSREKSVTMDRFKKSRTRKFFHPYARVGLYTFSVVPILNT